MRTLYLAILTLSLLLAFPMASNAENTDMNTEETTVEETEPTGTPASQKNRQAVMEKRQEIKADVTEKRSEFQEQLTERREAAKEDFAEKREEFKMRLEEISDEKKQQIVERVDAHITETNQNITTRLAEHLDKITEIIDRIEAKAGELEGDTKAVDDAVTVARAAVETAQDAVAEQAGKEYVIEITDDTSLREDVKTVVDQFRADIKATAETVKEARQKTVDAARALGQAKGPVMKQQGEETESGMTEELGG